MKIDETKDFTSQRKSFPELSCDDVVLCIGQALHVSKITKAILGDSSSSDMQIPIAGFSFSVLGIILGFYTSALNNFAGLWLVEAECIF